MIYLDILACVETALGTSLQPEQRRVAVERLAANLGGERHYLPSLPKLQRQRKIAAFAAGSATLVEIASASGVPIRTVQRLRNGK